MKAKSLGEIIFYLLPFTVTAACFGLMIYAAVLGEPFNISHEDGLLEWGSVYFFLVCAGLSIMALKTRFNELTRRQKIFLMLFAFVLIIGTGEEISWGQRIFHTGSQISRTQSSDALIQLGHGDRSLHNIRVKSRYIRFSIGSIFFGVMLLAGLFIHGIWLPVAIKRKRPKALMLTKITGVFVPPLRLGILVFLSALIFHYLKRTTDLTQTREYKEFIIPFIYCIMVAHSYFLDNARRPAVIWGLITITGIWVAGSIYIFAVK